MHPTQAANRQIWKLSKAHVESHDACLRIDLLASDSQSLDEAQWQGAGRHMLMEESAKWSASGSRAAEGEVGAACSGACEGSAGAGKGEQVVVGYWKQHSLLTHVVLRNAGHMVRCHLLMLESLSDASTPRCCSSGIMMARNQPSVLSATQWKSWPHSKPCLLGPCSRVGIRASEMECFMDSPLHRPAGCADGSHSAAHRVILDLAHSLLILLQATNKGDTMHSAC